MLTLYDSESFTHVLLSPFETAFKNHTRVPHVHANLNTSSHLTGTFRNFIMVYWNVW